MATRPNVPCPKCGAEIVPQPSVSIEYVKLICSGFSKEKGRLGVSQRCGFKDFVKVDERGNPLITEKERRKWQK